MNVQYKYIEYALDIEPKIRHKEYCDSIMSLKKEKNSAYCKKMQFGMMVINNTGKENEMDFSKKINELSHTADELTKEIQVLKSTGVGKDYVLTIDRTPYIFLMKSNSRKHLLRTVSKMARERKLSNSCHVRNI